MNHGRITYPIFLDMDYFFHDIIYVNIDKGVASSQYHMIGYMNRHHDFIPVM